MIPKTGKYFQERAQECESIATHTQDPRAKETLLYVASRWRALASEEDSDTNQRSSNGDSISSVG